MVYHNNILHLTKLITTHTITQSKFDSELDSHVDAIVKKGAVSQSGHGQAVMNSSVYLTFI